MPPPRRSSRISNISRRMAKKESVTVNLKFNKEKNISVTHKHTRTKKIAVNKRQSPIDIKKEDICHDPKACQTNSLCISYTKGDCCDVCMTSTGFRVNVGNNCSTVLRASHLPGDFQLAQFHAHWGENESCGSEHLLNGKAKAGEVHFVFWNKKYESFEKAMEKGDGLAVLGVFLKEGRPSTTYAPLFEAIKQAAGQSKNVPLPADFSLDQLLPEKDHRDFVTYLGSLTTPPYSESVIWTIFYEPVKVSKIQLDILRTIVPSNYRECQDLCQRKVLSSTRENKNLLL